MRARLKFALTALAAVAVLASCGFFTPASAQEGPEPRQAQLFRGHSDAAIQSEDLPTAPKPVTNEESKKPKSPRVFGVMPNELTVEGAIVARPLHTSEKFKLVTEGTLDPYEFVVVGFLSGIGQATNNTPEWGQGARGYGIRYAANFGDHSISNYMVGAVFPTIFRQDPRYFQSGKGSFLQRTAYALERIVITQGDSGKKEFNISELGGNALAGVISNTYHPARERSFGQAAQTWGTQIAVNAVGLELKEFWPDIRRRFTKRK